MLYIEDPGLRRSVVDQALLKRILKPSRDTLDKCNLLSELNRLGHLPVYRRPAIGIDREDALATVLP